MAIRKSSSGDNRTLQFILISLTIWYGYLWMTGNLVQTPEEVVEISEEGAPAVEVPAPTPSAFSLPNSLFLFNSDWMEMVAPRLNKAF